MDDSASRPSVERKARACIGSELQAGGCPGPGAVAAALCAAGKQVLEPAGAGLKLLSGIVDPDQEDGMLVAAGISAPLPGSRGSLTFSA